MGIYTKPLDIYHATVTRLENAQATMMEGHERFIGREGLVDAKALTGGDLTPSQTRGAFARGASPGASTPTGLRRQLSARQLSNRGLKGSAPLLPINKQRGKLSDSFRLPRTRSTGIQTFSLTQENPGGGIFRLLPGGTKKMVDSGFFAEIRRRWRPRNKTFIDWFRSQTNKP